MQLERRDQDSIYFRLFGFFWHLGRRLWLILPTSSPPLFPFLPLLRLRTVLLFILHRVLVDIRRTFGILVLPLLALLVASQKGVDEEVAVALLPETLRLVSRHRGLVPSRGKKRSEGGERKKDETSER